ncbi:MAG: MCP four helix bundle domain-containing protein, partial [Bacillota bacterium]
MNFFNRISIRNRILGIFVIWLLIFAFFGGVVYTNINRLGDVSENFYDQSMRLSTAAIEARVDIIKIQRSVRELMLMEDEGEIQRVLDDIKILDGKVLNNLDIIKDSSQISDVEQLEGEIRGVFIKWQDSRDDLVNMVLDKNKKDAMRIIQIKNSEFVKKLEEKLDRLDIYGENSAKSLITRSRGIQDIQKKSIGVWLGGLILIS